MAADIQELYDRGRRNWQEYARSKRAAVGPKESRIQTYDNIEGLARKTGLDLMNEELSRQRLYPQRYLPGEANVITTGMTTGPESPGGIGARVAKFISEKQYGEGGIEQREIANKERMASWQWHPGDEKTPPGFYPAQERATQDLEREKLGIAREALNKFSPEAGSGQFWETDPKTGKKVLVERPYVLSRDEKGNFVITFPQEQGQGAQPSGGGATPMPAPGVQSFTPGGSAMQNVGTALENAPFGGAATKGFNYLRRQKEEAKTGADLAARFGKATTQEEKRRILSEMTDQERGILRQHLLTQQGR